MHLSLRTELDRALAARERDGAAGRATSRLLARGDGWSVHDVVCTSGPEDRAFEERHSAVGVAVVVAGSFGYRSTAGRALLTPGSILLGNAGACFECGHEHGRGDRCVAFQFEPDAFERLAAEAGVAAGARRFSAARIPPLRAFAPTVAAAATRLVRQTSGDASSWEAIGLELATSVVALVAGLGDAPAATPPGAERRVVDAIRRIEDDPAGDHALERLAADSRLSKYHFLRTFRAVTGVAPHQYVLRTRLRDAALRLAKESTSVTDVAFDAGFGDLANFHHAFRAELGTTPRRWRLARRTGAVTTQREVGGTTPASRA